MPEKTAPEEYSVFQVGKGGMVLDASYNRPESRDDAYDMSTPSTQGDLIQAVSECQPLHWFVSSKYEEFYEGLSKPGKEWPDPNKIKDREDFAFWLKKMPDAQWQELKKAVDKWFDEEPDYAWEDDYCTYPIDGVAYAFNQFSSSGGFEDNEGVLNIIEGDRLGSNARYVVLLISVEAANALAAEQGLWFRFEAV